MPWEGWGSPGKLWGQQGRGSVPSLWSKWGAGSGVGTSQGCTDQRRAVGKEEEDGALSLRQVLVPGADWALLGTWSPEVRVGWVQDIPLVPVGISSVGIPGAPAESW